MGGAVAMGTVLLLACVVEWLRNGWSALDVFNRSLGGEQIWAQEYSLWVNRSERKTIIFGW